MWGNLAYITGAAIEYQIACPGAANSYLPISWNTTMIQLRGSVGGIIKTLPLFITHHLPFRFSKKRIGRGGGANFILKQDTIMQFPFHSAKWVNCKGDITHHFSPFLDAFANGTNPPKPLSFNTTSTTITNTKQHTQIVDRNTNPKYNSKSKFKQFSQQIN